MILFLDDDEAMHLKVGEALGGAGFAVKAVYWAADALEWASQEDPELVISDVLMPEMGGIAFHAAYVRRFPNRRTPFLFLSSLDGETDIVRGLEVGADDYLTKPFPSGVLVAKVRSHLRRARCDSAATFQGDLAKFPFAKVMQFCELQGFSGEVEIRAAGFSAGLAFKAGAPAPASDGEVLGRCLELTDGTFTLRAAPADFTALREAASSGGPERPEMPREKPAGRLSGVRAGARLFQIQTEFATSPSCQAVTVVMLDGKAVLKRASPPAEGFEVAAAEKLVVEQHTRVEAEVRGKVESLAAQKHAPTPKNQFDKLFEEGLARFLEKDYPAAVDSWEQARAIDPANKILAVNLGIARKKTGATGA